MVKRLTKSIIDAAKYTGDGRSPCFIWDTEIESFGVRVYPSGKKSFLVDYYHQGRKRRYTIGKYGHITLHQARELAREKLFSVQKGIDPLFERERDRGAETVSEFCQIYIERHAKQKKKSWRKDESYIRRFVLPKWGSRKLNSITGRDVSNLHIEIGERSPIAANRLLQQLSKMFNLAKRWQVVDQAWPNPASGIDKYREVKRDRWLDEGELSRLMVSIQEEQSPYVKAAFILYLLTGVRKSELLNARWDDVSFRRKELCLRETKNGNSHHVPLSGPAIEILKQLPRDAENAYILPGLRAGRPLVNLDKAWFRVRSRAGLTDVRLHDLRRTMASWMVQGGASLHLVGSLLNHRSLKTTEVYARLSNKSLRDVVDTHAERMLKMTSLRIINGG